MLESIVLTILVCSLGGILFILLRKIPILNSLSQNGTTGIKEQGIFLSVENKIKEVAVFFEKQIFLHKFFSWVKIMTLKIETKVDVVLHNIRKKAQDKSLKEKK